MNTSDTFECDLPDEDSSVKTMTGWFIAWLIVATVLGSGLRVWHLGQWSIWEDELYSIRDSVETKEKQYSKRFGYVPVGLGLWAGNEKFDDAIDTPVEDWLTYNLTAFRARIGPCILGILTIPVLGLASRRLLGNRGAVIAMLILAVSPWHVFWSQAARFYTQQFLFYSLALIWYFESTNRQSIRGLVSALACAALAYLSQPPAIFISLVFFADWVFGFIRGKPVRLSLLAYALIVATFAACLGLYIYDMKTFAGNFDAWAKLEGHSIPKLLAFTIYRTHPVLVAVAALAFLGLARVRPRLAVYLAAAAVLPVCALVGLKLIKGDDYYIHVRYGFIIHFAWIMLAAAGLDLLYHTARAKLTWPIAILAPTVVLAALSITTLEYHVFGHGNHERWKDALAYVDEQRATNDDALIITNREKVTRYYLQTGDIEVINEYPYAVDGKRVTPADAFQAAITKADNANRPAWIVARVVTPGGGRNPHYNFLPEQAELKRSFHPRHIQYTAIEVYYYDPNRQ